MDSIINGLTSDNGWLIAILIIIIIVLCIIGAKHGWVAIKTDTIQVGRDASIREQTIIRNQIEWAKNAIEGFEHDIPKTETYDEFRGKFVLEKVYDEVIKWIIFNHIEKTKTYIGLKQESVISIIKKYSYSEIYSSDDFLNSVKDHVVYIIEHLIDIRKEYGEY